MASQGPNSPSTVESSNAVGTRSWSQPTRAVASDDSRTLFSTGTTSDSWAESYYLKATSFGFTIPSGATIDGVLVEIEKQSNAPNSADVAVSLVVGGSVTGSNLGDTSTKWPSSDTYVSYGGATNKWGLTLTAAQVNGTDFGVVLQGKIYKQASLAYSQVDHIRITVYYTEGSTPDELTAKAIASGVPAVAKSTIAQKHALTSKSIASGVPTMQKATLGQKHVLTAKVIASGVPTVGKATLADVPADVTDELTAKNISAGTPVVSKPTLAEVAPIPVDTGTAAPYYYQQLFDRVRRTDGEELILLAVMELM